MKNTIYLIISILVFSCTKKTESNISKKTKEVSLAVVDTLDFFSDSVKFGSKEKNRIDILKIGTQDSTIIKVFLFEKNKKAWQLKDSLLLRGERIEDLKTEVKDFNNDNFNDVIFTSGMAARGGNIVQTLILYSPKDKSLKWIKNSESYPNLMYNKKLNCVDALILTGGETTYFLKIKNDSLKEFANVDHRDGNITAEIVDENGKWKEIKSIKNQSQDMKRFINYNPIEERE
ncbi:hypothetical protein D3C72_1335310 [compost metagenome]|jgi:hypothetical protein